MHSFAIGVTSQVFDILRTEKNAFSRTSIDEKLFIIFEQHRLLLSDGIIEYYKKKLDSPESIDYFIDAVGYQNNKIEYIIDDENENSSGLEKLISAVKKTEMKFLLGEKRDISPCSGKGINLISPSEIVSGTDTLLSKKYIFPLVQHFETNCLCENIAKWFKVLFENEKKIIIIDKYILNTNAIKSLGKYYLPNIDGKTEIEIYCLKEQDCSDNEIQSKANDSCFDNRSVKIFYSNKMEHDRFIILSDIYISIGAGIDFLQENGKVKSCTVSIQWNQKNNCPSIPQNAIKIR